MKRRFVLNETTVALRNAELEPSSWVYAWIANEKPTQVMYIGATGLPPVVPAWLHVSDDNPDIGRIRARHPEFMRGDVTVRAFEISSDLDRQDVKTWVIKMLAEPAAPPPDASAEQVCARHIVDALRNPRI